MKICKECKISIKYQWIMLNIEKGLLITKVSKISRIHQDTLYIWKRKYLEEGIEGLKDKSRAPHTHPNEYGCETKEKIKLLRREEKGEFVVIVKGK